MAMKSSDHLEDLRNPDLVLEAIALREGGAVTHVQVSLDQPLLELHHLRDLPVVDLQSEVVTLGLHIITISS